MVRALFLAATLAAAPLTVAAVTISPDGTLRHGRTCDLASGPCFFDVTANEGDGRQKFTFRFTASQETIATVHFTLLQVTGMFRNLVLA